MEHTFSPTPKKEIKIEEGQFSFLEAIKKIMEGKKIHKLEWQDKEYYGFLNGEFLSLHKPDGKNYQWLISSGDLFGTDYIVI